MSADPAQHADSIAQVDLPAKRPRGGRRASNRDISAEERKRLRVLKNRESAMKSLAKKAEYSARLEKLKTEAEEEHAATREKVQQLLTLALDLRSHMDKLPGDETLLLAQLDSVLARSAKLLNEDADFAGTQLEQKVDTVAPVNVKEQPQL